MADKWPPVEILDTRDPQCWEAWLNDNASTAEKKVEALQKRLAYWKKKNAQSSEDRAINLLPGEAALLETHLNEVERVRAECASDFRL